jgi:hypothetical protein
MLLRRYYDKAEAPVSAKSPNVTPQPEQEEETENQNPKTKNKSNKKAAEEQSE